MVVLGEPELSMKPLSHKGSHKVDVRQITCTLNWSHLKPADRLTDAGFKMDKWNSSTYCPQPFPANIPTLLIYSGLMGVLKTVLEAVGNKRATTEQSDAIDKASKKLLTATKQIMTVWQNKVDMDLLNGVAIANDGGFDYSDGGTRGQRAEGLFRTVEPGVLQGQLSGGGFRQWESTADHATTITKEDPTRGGVIILRNLVSKKEYGVRGRLVLTKGRFGAWSDWMYEIAL